MVELGYLQVTYIGDRFDDEDSFGNMKDVDFFHQSR